MSPPRRVAAALALLLAALLASTGSSQAVQAGQRLPSIFATDVTGRTWRLTSLLRGRPTLLVAITDRGAADRMRAWFDHADVQVPRANRVSIVSISKPFFVSDGYVRQRARNQVPRRWWHQTIVETDREVVKELLGLPKGDEAAWAFAIAGDGRILAAARGDPASPQAAAIWRALATR